MSNVTLTERIYKAMGDLKKTMSKVESVRGNIGNLYKAGIPKDDPTDIKPFLKDWIYPKIEEIGSELDSLMQKLDAMYALADNQKCQNLINEIDEILKQHKEKYGEN